MIVLLAEYISVTSMSSRGKKFFFLFFVPWWKFIMLTGKTEPVFDMTGKLLLSSSCPALRQRTDGLWVRGQGCSTRLQPKIGFFLKHWFTWLSLNWRAGIKARKKKRQMRSKNGRETMFIIPLRYSSSARAGRASTLHSHIKGEEKKRLFTLRNHTGVCCAFQCVCMSICLHVCMSYLWVHLRHWAAGYAALKGCVSAAIPLSLTHTHSYTHKHTHTHMGSLPLFCLCVHIIHHLCSVCLYSIIDALS